MKRFQILMYHGIHNNCEDPGDYDPVFSLSVTKFEEQIRWLITNGFKCLLLDEVNDADPTGNYVVITFDDGDKSNIVAALPIIEKYNIRAEFFITTNRIGHKNSMDVSDIKKLSEMGMSIQSHGVTHKFLSSMSRNDVINELSKSKEVLEEITNESVVALSLPGGRGNNLVRKVASDLGYSDICTSKMGMNHLENNRYKLKRMTIYQNMNLKKFESIILGKGSYYYLCIVRQNILSILKMIIGNELYDKFWRKLFSCKQ